MKLCNAVLPTLLIVLLLYKGNNALENQNESPEKSLKNNKNPLENILFYNRQNTTEQGSIRRVKRQFYPYYADIYHRPRPLPIILVGGGFTTFGRGLAFGGTGIGRFGGRGFGARGFGGRGFGGFGGRGFGGGRGGRG
ncbi:cold shock protein 2-like [Colias croceus]|uniref:cold shock protein 2-like n=1 Tax=Colias crocea TaxID=72248 RepID=UPI001E27E992|nr:cold shock protein 2-like [Colias croceus]